MSFPAVSILRAGSLIDYPSTLDTDVSRGTAMLAAFAASTSGDEILALDKTYDWGSNYLEAPDGVDFTGKGSDRTILLSQFNIVTGTVKATIRPGSGSTWRGFTIWANNPIKRGSPFGSQTQAGDWLNVLVEDFIFIGAIDCLHINASAVGAGINASATFRHGKMYSEFDTVSVVNPNGGTISLIFDDVYFEATTPEQTYPYASYSDTPTKGGLCRAVAVNSGDTHITLYGCSALVGGGISHNYGLAQLSASGSITAHGFDCTILDDLGGVNARTSGTNITDTADTLAIDATQSIRSRRRSFSAATRTAGPYYTKQGPLTSTRGGWNEIT